MPLTCANTRRPRLPYRIPAGRIMIIRVRGASRRLRTSLLSLVSWRLGASGEWAGGLVDQVRDGPGAWRCSHDREAPGRRQRREPGCRYRRRAYGDRWLVADGPIPYTEDPPPPLGPGEDAFCAVHARTRKVSITAALSHARGRSNPHQKGAPSSIPATATAIPEGRGHSSRTPPTAPTAWRS